MYSREQRAEVLDFHFAEPGRTVSATISHFGYPTERTLLYWIGQDPRGQVRQRATRGQITYSDKEKRAVIDYFAKHTEKTLKEIVKKFGYPSVACLAKWLEDAGYELPKQRKNESYTRAQKERVCRYAVAHPEMSRKEVCSLFGYPTGPCLNKWCIELYGEAGRPQGPYTEDEKALALDLCFRQQERKIKEIAREYGFPIPTHVLFPLLRKDPRWAEDPRNPLVKQRLREQITDLYFSDVHLRTAHVSDAFGNSYTPAGVLKLVRKDQRFGSATFYGFTEEQRKQVMDLYYGGDELTQREIAKEVGFPVPNRVFYEWKVTDSRAASLPKYVRAEPKTFAEKQACVALVIEGGLSREEAAARCSVVKSTVTNWLRSRSRKGLISLVAKRDLPPKRRTDISVPDKDPADFTEEDIRNLKARNEELEFENDVLKAIFDVLKKEPGLDENSLCNREKTLIINSLRPKYKLGVLLKRLGMAKSSYEYSARAAEREDKYGTLRTVITTIFQNSLHAYGYRRIWAALRSPSEDGGYGIIVSEKVVRRLMREESLVTLPAKKLQRYNSYRGTVGRIAPNLLQRDFHADEPHKKLLTDITEFHLNGFKMYLSPLVDCYNGEVVSYAISTRPQQGLVMKMLDLGKREMNPDDKPIVHSDQGSQYQSPVYVNALKEAGWIQSMSRKGCCPDNSACEGFFGRLKNEFFYNHDFSDYTVGAFATALSDWIEWYNNERIKDSLGYKSPVRYRLENACAAA